MSVMNDSDAAFRQQLEKLNDGGELQLECCGITMLVSYAHDTYIILVETRVAPDRFYDFIQDEKYDLQYNEQYLFHGNKIYYCMFVKDINFSKIFNCAFSVINRSMAYQ